MKKLILIAMIGAAVAGCNTTTFKQTGKDGSSVTIVNSRVLWSSEAYTAQFSTNGASLTANKSNVDSAAVAAIAQGVMQGMAAAAKP